MNAKKLKIASLFRRSWTYLRNIVLTIHARAVFTFGFLPNLERLILYLETRVPIFFTYRIRFFPQKLNRTANSFTIGNKTFSSRQMDENVYKSRNLNANYDSIGIILQGPVDHRNSFTFRICKLYLEMFPGAQVILSTWDNEDISEFSFFKKYSNFYLIQNSIPVFPGISNINLQIESTFNAVKFAEKLGCEYLVKSRCDQGLLNSSALEVLLYYIGEWPGRIIVTSRNSFVFRLYGVSDMFQFGKTKEVKEFWSAPKDLREPSDVFFRNDMTLYEYSNLNIVETYLGSSYLKILGTEPIFSLKQSLEFVRDRFVVIDDANLDLVWDKYSRNESPWKILQGKNSFREFTHTDWERLQKELSFILRNQDFMHERVLE